ncbi:hypothetical protein FOZ62_028463, partial [Perkinsus olseni]
MISTTRAPARCIFLSHARLTLVRYNTTPPAADEVVTEQERWELHSSKSWMESPIALTKLVWRTSMRGVRDERLWAKLSKRAVLMSVHMGHRELTTCLLGFAKIRYRDPKLLQSISPAILKNISEFDTLELALLLGAYRRLEYRRIDQIELLMNELCLPDRIPTWTSLIIALSCNAAGVFGIYHAPFWNAVGREIERAT